MSTIGVTGATGKLGRATLEHLTERVTPADLVAIVRRPERARDLAERGIAVRRAEYGDPAALDEALSGVDTLMFISNLDPHARRQEHGNVVAAAKRAGVGHIVYTSFVDVGGAGILAETHAMTEEMIRTAAIPSTILRDQFYMDAYVVEIEIAMRIGKYRSPSGDAGIALVSRDDIARMAAVVCSEGGPHVGQIYVPTGPETVTPATFARVASELSRRSIEVEPITFEQLADDYRARGMSPEMVEMSVMLERIIATNNLAATTDDVRRVTGREPTSLLDLARRSLAPTEG